MAFDKIIKRYVMPPEKFKEFMQDKICYHFNVHWVEIWKGIVPLERYIPCDEFILPNTLKLKRYYPEKGYSEECLSCETTENKHFWEYHYWKATISDKNGKIYVREYAPTKD